MEGGNLSQAQATSQNPSPAASSSAYSSEATAQGRGELSAGDGRGERPESASSKKSATHGAEKTGDEAAIRTTVQQETRVADGQPAVISAAASAPVREMAGGRGAAGEAIAASIPTATGTALREPFAAIDTEGAPARSAWIHAGAQRAEAGFQDPALGWVGVRADASGGGVHAQLVPGSADAAAALGSHMAGLNAYLAEHHTQVAPVTLSAPENGWAEMGNNQGSESGAGNQPGQEASQGAESGSQNSPDRSLHAPSLAAAGAIAPTVDLARGGLPGGVHISVMA
jgi:hypothetical protein